MTSFTPIHANTPTDQALAEVREYMARKHTPGPWLKEPGDTIICIRSTSGNGSYRIADVGGRPYWLKFDATDEANAHLIAAAPDLLAACKKCMISDGDYITEMAVAIAKAEGRS